MAAHLDLHAPVSDLAAGLIDIPSTSKNEAAIADAIFAQLNQLSHLEVQRFSNSIIARTNLGKARRVILAGHIDTVPEANNLPHSFNSDRTELWGLGAIDMKSGIAIMLKLAQIKDPKFDLIFAFYECEEIDSQFNGLKKIIELNPELLTGDLAILLEPTSSHIEAGCQGTLRAKVTAQGKRSHSARNWMGENAIYNAQKILDALQNFEIREPVISGLKFREGISPVKISGGIAGNVIPDSCTIEINYRFAPDLSLRDAKSKFLDYFKSWEVEIVDIAPGAMPGLDIDIAQSLATSTNKVVNPKFGWTDVARFTELGIPALNYGPGDPSLAHAENEHLPISQIEDCLAVLTNWLKI